ncbi:hypothetical protein [Actinoplanes couchii]|uniref:Uncharacterized protein n=1 Tax=Actinoplanes couchii TaxID=403638 RepID=A0ABQ3XMK2_9ACTN|nr:hypothetical protein [Actinoplanes couchii]MDR6321628.1 hypothetical protein [Actinoplanes couchii]GID59723.1 hypothetical protein Aco03nite_081270 [Actinoplanes couchii]
MIPFPPQVVYRPPVSRLVLAVLDEQAISRLHRLRSRRGERSSWRSARFTPASARRHRVSHWKARRGGRR